MRFASIRSMDISDGEGIGVALYTQGCPIHCKGCHNPQTWDYDFGEEYNEFYEKTILDLMSKQYINHFSCLGGEPLISRNLKPLIKLFKDIKTLYPEKKIWVWSGYTWELITRTAYKDNLNIATIPNYTNEDRENLKILLQYIDVLVAGPYIDEQRDITLKWRGSSNQKVIDVQKTLEDDLNSIVYYE